MGRVNALISDVLLREGGDRYTNDPSDSGGPTKYGITQATLAKWRGKIVTPADVADLTEAEARQIYLARYWSGPGFDKIAPISLTVAEELLDTGVNMGPARAVEFLQRALTAFNNRGAYYPDLMVDGQLGPATLAALKAYFAKRGTDGERVLLFTLNALQVGRYVEIAEKHEKNEEFLYGWLRTRVVL